MAKRSSQKRRTAERKARQRRAICRYYRDAQKRGPFSGAWGSYIEWSHLAEISKQQIMERFG